ncbi:Tetratricopeptide repeat protein [compost metagenome]
MDGALSAFLTALDLDPGVSSVHNNLGVLYWQLGLRERALEHFEWALTLGPNDPDTLANCVDAYRAQGKIQALIEILQLHREPTDPTLSALLEELGAVGSLDHPISSP